MTATRSRDLCRRDGGSIEAAAVEPAEREALAAAGLAAAAAVSAADAARIEAGELRPPIGAVQRILAAAGRALSVRLEVCDCHDDGLHLRAVADPDRYARTMSLTRQAFRSDGARCRRVARGRLR